MEQVAFGTDSLALNPEPRCLCVLLLDTSGSMGGEPIQQLNQGLVTLKDELMADELAKKRVEIAIVTFGPVTDLQGCVTAENFIPPSLTAQDETPMGEALVRGIQIIEARKAEYKANGVKYYRPWVFLITDGGPTDKNKPVWNEACTQIRTGEDRKNFAFFPIAVEGADIETLRTVCPSKDVIQLKGLRFRDLFKWLSSSLKSVSQSKPGDAVKLDTPVGPSGWGTV